jgi:hypothetical protein
MNPNQPISPETTGSPFDWKSTETDFLQLTPTQRIQWLETCIEEFLSLRKAAGLGFPTRENDRSY